MSPYIYLNLRTFTIHINGYDPISIPHKCMVSRVQCPYGHISCSHKRTSNLHNRIIENCIFQFCIHITYIRYIHSFSLLNFEKSQPLNAPTINAMAITCCNFNPNHKMERKVYVNRIDAA